uniref:ARAD1D03630p n=1 Tax=Blastobotrys adeninivorans TaxID=409370 RepID=A0A060TDY4_BLAAD
MEGSSGSNPNSNSRRHSFLDWFGSFGHQQPGMSDMTRSNSLSGPPVPQDMPRRYSSAVMHAAQNNNLPQRRMSTSRISHDEALNLSRAVNSPPGPGHGFGSHGSHGALSPHSHLHSPNSHAQQPQSPHLAQQAQQAQQSQQAQVSQQPQSPSGVPRSQPIRIQRKRGDSGANYEGMGLVAAFSGGPSSF